MNYSLKLTHLYPKEMNIYGDMGNIIALKRRCQWRGIDLEVNEIGHDTKLPFQPADIYFMGGGQDNDMYAVFDDLVANKREFIKSEVEQYKVFLLICGAFQLFGDFFLAADGRRIEGLGILPIETKAPGDTIAERCLGNLVTELSPELEKEVAAAYPGRCENTIVGFENHSGQTYFRSGDISSVGHVKAGKGNNASEAIEGARFQNIFGSYTHGSLLPKNPHMADFLLSLALKNKYGADASLSKLDDEVEWSAHRSVRDAILNG